MWGYYLHTHLHGEAAEYVGDKDSWQNRYAELWEKLDSRYANRWNLASETIKSSVLSSPPQDPSQMVKYIHDQLNCIRGIDSLGLDGGQLAIHILLMKLPENIATPIRQGLRLKRRDKGDQDYKFTPEEFRDVVNDTLVNKTITPIPPITLYSSGPSLNS